MPTQVVMPQLGESVLEATLTKWLKAVGESVHENEPLVEVNTDKVDTEVPSPASGVLLEILAPEGTTVQAGALLARIGKPGEADTQSASLRPKRLPVLSCPPRLRLDRFRRRPPGAAAIWVSFHLW